MSGGLRRCRVWYRNRLDRGRWLDHRRRLHRRRNVGLIDVEATNDQPGEQYPCANSFSYSPQQPFAPLPVFLL
jgi:hypothetical protein